MGMGRARRDAERTAGGTAVAALLPVFGVEVTDRQLVLHGLADFAARVAANAQREFARGKPVGHLPWITAYGNLHVAIEFFDKWRAEVRMIVKNCKVAPMPKAVGSSDTIFPFHLGCNRSQYDLNSPGLACFKL